MLKEFFDSIVNIGRQTVDVQFHSHPEIHGKVWLQDQRGITQVECPPPLRKPKLLGFNDLVTMLRDGSIAAKPEVYICAGRITAFLDADDRRQLVVLDLVPTTRFTLAKSLETKALVGQPREIVKWLRVEMHGGTHGHLIQSLSRVDFQRTSTGTNRTEHGKESYGRSVEAIVQQADQVPESFNLVCPIWANEGFNRYSCNVECSVYLNTEAQNVELRVLSDESSRALNQAMFALSVDLRDALPNVPVFLGAP